MDRREFSCGVGHGPNPRWWLDGLGMQVDLKYIEDMSPEECKAELKRIEVQHGWGSWRYTRCRVLSRMRDATAQEVASALQRWAKLAAEWGVPVLDLVRLRKTIDA